MSALQQDHCREGRTDTLLQAGTQVAGIPWLPAKAIANPLRRKTFQLSTPGFPQIRVKTKKKKKSHDQSSPNTYENVPP